MAKRLKQQIDCENSGHYIFAGYSLPRVGINGYLRPGLVTLTPTQPPSCVIQWTDAAGGQDVPHWVVHALFGWHAPQTLQQKQQQILCLVVAGLVQWVEQANIYLEVYASTQRSRV